MRKHFGALAAIAYAMAADSPAINTGITQDIEPSKLSGKKYTVMPKGCKRYTFKYEGKVFACIAINQKSAFRKFQKWVREGGDQ